jgi:hypothetical protein
LCRGGSGVKSACIRYGTSFEAARPDAKVRPAATSPRLGGRRAVGGSIAIESPNWTIFEVGHLRTISTDCLSSVYETAIKGLLIYFIVSARRFIAVSLVRICH